MRRPRADGGADPLVRAGPPGPASRHPSPLPPWEASRRGRRLRTRGSAPPFWESYMSSPASQFFQAFQLGLRFFLDALLFVGAADGEVLAILAAVFARRRGERAVDDRLIDYFQHVLHAAARPIVQWDIDGGVILRDGGVVETAGRDGLAQDLFGGQGVERGLEHFTLAHGLRARFRNAAGLVIRSEEHTSELQSLRHLVCRLLLEKKKRD